MCILLLRNWFDLWINFLVDEMDPFLSCISLYSSKVKDASTPKEKWRTSQGRIEIRTPNEMGELRTHACSICVCVEAFMCFTIRYWTEVFYASLNYKWFLEAGPAQTILFYAIERQSLNPAGNCSSSSFVCVFYVYVCVLRMYVCMYVCCNDMFVAWLVLTSKTKAQQQQ